MHISEIRKFFTENERWAVSKVFQNYYCDGLIEIAKDDDVIASLFIKLGLIEEADLNG